MKAISNERINSSSKGIKKGKISYLLFKLIREGVMSMLMLRNGGDDGHVLSTFTDIPDRRSSSNLVNKDVIWLILIKFMRFIARKEMSVNGWKRV